MAWAFVQSTTNTSDAADTTITKAFSTNPTTGNLIVVSFGWGDTDLTPTVTDGTNTYHSATKLFTGDGQGHAIFYAYNITGGALTVSANFAGNSVSFRRLIISEYSGILTGSDPLDKFAINFQSGAGSTGTNGITSGSVTTTSGQNGQLIYGSTQNVGDAGAGINAGTTVAFTERVSITGETFTTEDFTQTTAGSIAATFTHATGNRDMCTAIATFKIAVADLSPNLSGTVSTMSPGTLSTSALVALALTGTAITGSIGTIGYTVPNQYSLSGVSSTLSLGSMTYDGIDQNAVYQAIYRGDA